MSERYTLGVWDADQSPPRYCVVRSDGRQMPTGETVELLNEQQSEIEQLRTEGANLQAKIERLQAVVDAARVYVELFTDPGRGGVFEAYCKLCKAIAETEVSGE